MSEPAYQIAAFYRFTPLDDIPALRTDLRAFGADIPGLCGTILLAPEGVNGTIGAFPEGLARMMDFLDARTGIRQGEVKYSNAARKPFNRFKVRPKKEIITMKCPEANPHKQVGIYVSPQEWNSVIADPDVVVIDTRNIYETDVGTFKNAIDPRLQTFGEFPEWVEKNMNPATHTKVAMFCTGGIRCEKASSYMLAHGFKEVYHLKGGILKYLEDVPPDQSLWQGECFIFDQRVAVTHGLQEGSYETCYGCRQPLMPQDIEHPAYEKGVSCAHCIDRLTPARAKALRTRHEQITRKSNADNNHQRD